MSIGKNIRKLREEHGLSQEEFGKIAGVSDKAVSTWENDTKIPRMGSIQKIADYFGIKKSDLIEDEQSAISTKSSEITDEDIRRIWRAKLNMPSEEWGRFMGVAMGGFSKYFSDDYIDEDTDE